MEREGPSGLAPKPIGELDQDELIIRLLFTVNHLSRWLTPIHDETRLVRAVRRSEPSVKELVIELRDQELRVFPRMHAIATQNRPDLDRLPPVVRSTADIAWDDQASVFEIVAEFRRLRQSTTSLLRSLPNDAWARDGISRNEHDWTIRSLAEYLLLDDSRLLARMDEALLRTGVRDRIAAVSRASYEELQRLAP
ncbi:MAG: hypothetical protein H0U10_16960 [Chloroflexia bacterium]|nr:hypothetical protein [Chloroflexia bacterium]